MRNAMILMLACTSVWACDDPKPAEQAAEPAAAAVAPAAVKAAAEPAKPEPAAAEAAEKKAEQKAVDENPLTPCCRALGRLGFVQHSPEYTGAAKECGEGMTANKTIDQISGAIKKTLKGKPLPDECAGK